MAIVKVTESNFEQEVLQAEEKLGEAITKYDDIVSGMDSELKSNNEKFNEELEKIVDGMFKGR